MGREVEIGTIGPGNLSLAWTFPRLRGLPWMSGSLGVSRGVWESCS